ncbi:MAG: MG2 domain-containing protein [Candidatus Azobacteroides sp.]|nr:MG2 domain-containing protein [Candidatus Azobacteroides sp.]
MKRIAKITALFLFTGCVATLYSQEDAAWDSAVTNIARQLIVFPQEKIYVQTDKPYYMNGEKIFFRVFLLDAFSNKQDTLSRYVYVELIHPADSIVQRVKIRPDENHLFYGAIPLRENLPQGDYNIRAYTRYMQNQGESSFFSKQVRIGDPQILKGKTQTNSRFAEDKKTNAEDFDLTFYPEGGQLVAGQVSDVAFKALCTDGTALNISGEITDSKGNIVTEFKTVHEGMGEFFISPLPAERYQAVCRYDGRTLRFDLPEAQPLAMALQAVVRDNTLQIRVNKSESASLPELYLLIHSRGSVVYAKAWDGVKNFIVFDRSDFPSGINHILLLTKDLQIVSERLVFLLNKDQGLASFQAQKDAYGKREQVQAQIQLEDEKQHPLKGNFSIAITNDREVISDSTSGILSGILLSSELRGHIENPEYYFQKGNKDAEQAADLLMKTHGWTRYAFSDVIHGKLNYPEIPFETSQKIAGTVKSGVRSRLAKNAQLSILSLKDHFLDTTQSGPNGRYVFHDFEFPDSTWYVIQALNSKEKGRYRTELYIDKDTFPGMHVQWNEPIRKDEKTDSVFRDYMIKADQQYTFEHGARVINLPEVQIRGVRKDQNKYKSSFYGEPDYFMPEEVIKRSGAIFIKDLFYDVPGVYVSGNVISIRRGGPPFILIDDIPLIQGEGNSPDNQTVIDYLNMINVNDVEQIDVLKDGASLTIFGSRGMNGVINIHTKRGEEFNPILPDNIKSVMPLGYQLPIEFYSPQYDTQESRNNSTPDLRTTIYWKPNGLTDEEGIAQVDFYTADDPATYSIVIEGVSEDGKLIHYRGESVITVE